MNEKHIMIIIAVLKLLRKITRQLQGLVDQHKNAIAGK